MKPSKPGINIAATNSSSYINSSTMIYMRSMQVEDYTHLLNSSECRRGRTLIEVFLALSRDGHWQYLPTISIFLFVPLNFELSSPSQAFPGSQPCLLVQEHSRGSSPVSSEGDGGNQVGCFSKNQNQVGLFSIMDFHKKQKKMQNWRQWSLISP